MESQEVIDGPVNLGNPTEYPINDVVKLVLNLTESGSRAVYSPLPQDDPCQRQPVVSKAKRYLGWTPKVGLSSGLVDTISYFRGLVGEV